MISIILETIKPVRLLSVLLEQRTELPSVPAKTHKLVSGKLVFCKSSLSRAEGT